MLFNSQILFAWCCCEIRIKEIWNASCSQKQPFSSSFLSNNISPAAEVKYTIWKSWKYLKLKIKFSTNRILFHLLKVKKRKSGITTVRLKLSLILKLFANQEQTKNKKKKASFAHASFQTQTRYPHWQILNWTFPLSRFQKDPEKVQKDSTGQQLKTPNSCEAGTTRRQNLKL